ncbi:hypothetical protein BDB00DRAFT_559108 [Zychaea mexicana]|uniref:uncharacterized protein n=1 Tax=Zychaea mexicana TaxID=64656 RepID=UPI0022FEFA51|nr:uncharacterized protein BDB00DRAFT_559108 [Zychaea mexicana]KAI9490363.1 hypothetical protein BDB00DRAFT_559108 [Zychaea mexicana]
MQNIHGWAHLCFLSPCYIDDDHNSEGVIFREFRGHVISTISTADPTRSTMNTTFGIAGVYEPNHEDPKHNDCMDPVLFYQTTLKGYNNSSEQRQSIPITTSNSFLVRRVTGDDAAGLSTEPQDNPDEQCLHFETENFLVGTKAVEHVKKYLGEHVLLTMAGGKTDAEGEQEAVVCIGKIDITIK